MTTLALAPGKRRGTQAAGATTNIKIGGCAPLVSSAANLLSHTTVVTAFNLRLPNTINADYSKASVL